MSKSRTRGSSMPAWAVGVRVFAESIAGHDLPAAAAPVHAITDGGERAIGTAALFRSAGGGGGTELAEQLRAEFKRAMVGIPPFEWVVDNQDNYAFAYVRPDHRARFEAAIRLIPYEPAPGMRPPELHGVGECQERERRLR
jgi:hypothetical protein